MAPEQLLSAAPAAPETAGAALPLPGGLSLSIPGVPAWALWLAGGVLVYSLLAG